LLYEERPFIFLKAPPLLASKIHTRPTTADQTNESDLPHTTIATCRKRLRKGGEDE